MSGEIKFESAGEICQGCLSQGRSLRPLGARSEVFYTLVGNSTGINFVMSSDTMKMCWECIARLDRVMQFRMQLCQAQNRLMEMLYNMNTNIASLSMLSKITKNAYDYEFDHKPIKDKIKPTVEPEPVEIDIEPDNLSLIKLEKLTNDEIRVLNEENYTEYIDNYDEIPSEYDDTTLKTEVYINDSDPIKKEKKKKKRIKKEVNYNREYKNRTYHEQVVVKNLDVDYDKLSNEDATVYFDKVYLDEREVEELVCKKEREVHRWFKHRCKECKLGFMATADFYRHQNFEHQKADSSSYKCRLCNKIQPTLDALSRHWKFAHSLFFVCKLCNAYVRVTGKTKHLKLQHMKKYCCTACRMEFQTMLAFSAHYRKEHGRFICDYCGKSCYQKSVLIKHIRFHHSINQCKICVKTFKKYRIYIDHLKHLHPEKLTAKVDKELAYCVECNRQFPSVPLYKRHLNESPRHNPKTPKSIPCPECGKIFKRKDNLRNHIDHLHASVKKHHCAMCNKSYANKWGLKTHNLNFHLKVPKVKDKICDLCGRGFHTTRVLTHHRRTHTGERPYACAYCTATFAQQYAMVTHQKTQHKDANRSYTHTL